MARGTADASEPERDRCGSVPLSPVGREQVHAAEAARLERRHAVQERDYVVSGNVCSRQRSLVLSGYMQCMRVLGLQVPDVCNFPTGVRAQAERFARRGRTGEDPGWKL